MTTELLCLGEMLIDELPDVSRPGGAPYNVACHAAQAGVRTALVSACGFDAAADTLVGELERRGVQTEMIARLEAPSGRVVVVQGDDGKPRYDICAAVAWDQIPLSERALTCARQARALCFGSLAARSESSRQTILALAAAAPEAWRICDINLRPPYEDPAILHAILQRANVLKVSDEELPRLMRRLGLDTGDLDAATKGLFDRYDLRLIALTCGPGGALIQRPQTQACWSPAPDGPVVDTVGAGDAFTSVVIIGLLAGWSDQTILERAQVIATWVCGQAGATPLWSQGERDLLQV